MATLVSLTLDCLDMLYGQTPMQRPDMDTLATAVSSNSDASWQFDQAGSQFWERSDYAEYFDGTGTAGEVVQFLEHHDVADSDVKVVRAQRRTTAAASFSAGDVFLKNPPFTHTEIQRAINEVIDSDLQNGIWYRSARTIAYSTGRNRYPANASDYKIERMYQYDMSSSSLGDATFDYTGGASEDLWTLASHGLSVGDPVRFSAVGTGADEYSTGIVYYVATVPSTSTFQLSATESTTVLEGTADSVGTWTIESIVFSYREFPDHWYDLKTDVVATADSTTRSVLLKSLYDQSDTVHYIARTRPSSSSVASLPTEIANAVPWGTLARLLGGTAVRHRYDSAAQAGTIPYADSEFFRATFESMLDNTRRRLLKELQPQKHFILGPTSVG